MVRCAVDKLVATSAATSPTTAATAPGPALSGFTHPKRATTHILTVQGLHGRFGRALVLELDERETARATGFPVGDQSD